jgi:geranylgeranyl diphosphate synthase, type I
MITVPGPGTGQAWEVLRQACEHTEPELRSAVDRLSEPVRSVARYHFGWQDAVGEPGQTAWGKGIRGALALASAQAVGAPSEQAVPVAAAVELVHNFSLVHDDVMDDDRSRRGRPATWSVFGKAQAIVAGDALLTLAIDVIARSQNSSWRDAAVRELCSALLRLAAGQAADLTFETRTDVDLNECLTMAAGKTAALLASACALGALAGEAEPDRVEALRGFGHHLGLAFQLVDDLLDIWGNTSATGKSVGSDLRMRKKSLPVVAAMRSDTAAGSRLTETYHRTDPMHDADILEAARMIEDAGGRQWATAEAARQRDLALHCLATALPTRDGACALALIADLIIHRER